MQPTGIRAHVMQNQAWGQCVLSCAGYLSASGGVMLKIGVLLAGNGGTDAGRQPKAGTEPDIESLLPELTAPLALFMFSLCLGPCTPVSLYDPWPGWVLIINATSSTDSILSL